MIRRRSVILGLGFWVGLCCATQSEELPRITGIGAVQREVCGAFAKDDFNDGKPNWEVFGEWINSKSFRYAEEKGRLNLYAEDATLYSGWVTKPIPSTDVVLAARIDTRSSVRSQPHRCLVHLCASGENSPDYWMELAAEDHIDGKAILFTLVTNLPEYAKKDVPPWKPIIWSRKPGEDGYLVKLERSSDGMFRCFVQLDGQWLPVGAPYLYPARTMKVELKASAGASGIRSSMWFDDFRFYPHPGSRYITVKTPGLPEKFLGPSGTVHKQSDLVVRLFKADGKTLVGEVELYAFGEGLIPLRDADWDIYPQPAIFRVYLSGKQIGKDVIVEKKDVDGLYPGDVWAFKLDKTPTEVNSSH